MWWYRLTKMADWTCFADVREEFASTDSGQTMQQETMQQETMQQDST
jgi:hypothetical protein